MDLRTRPKYTLGLLGLQIPRSAVYVFATLVVGAMGMFQQLSVFKGKPQPTLLLILGVINRFR